MPTSVPDHYQVLGVERDATRQEIAKAYRLQMRTFHSDAGDAAETPEAKAALDELSKEISAAFNTLNNPDKRAAYDRELAAAEGTPTPENSGSSPGHRFPHTDSDTTGAQGRAEPDLTVDPRQWRWFTPAPSADQDKPRSRRRIPLWVVSTLALLTWAAWFYPSMVGWSVPVRIAGGPALYIDTATFVVIGVVAHLLITVLVFTGGILTGFALVIPAALAVSAVITELAVMSGSLEGSAAWFARLAPLVATLGSLATSVWCLMLVGAAESRAERKQRAFLRETPFIQIGNRTLGARHQDVDTIIGTLAGAFAHRDGVRMFLMPERIEVAPGGSVRTQVLISTAKDLHLVSVPLIGRRGVQVVGGRIEADGDVHRNVVLDEIASLSPALRGINVHGYVVLPLLNSPLPEPTVIAGVTYGSFHQVIQKIGEVSAEQLDRPAPKVHEQVFSVIGRIL